jgi:hypothetical protein
MCVALMTSVMRVEAERLRRGWPEVRIVEYV